ncbi:MAG TPA: metallophosphoesterase [Opitutaceae bacterium]|nr:metallophosphoesterase [Opitutaceae bacterium]
MNPTTTRRQFLGAIAAAAGALAADGLSQQRAAAPRGDGRRGHRPGDFILPRELEDFARLSLVLGRATDRAVTMSALSREAAEAYYEFGPASASTARTEPVAWPAGEPVETLFSKLQPDTDYFYRAHVRRPGETAFQLRREGRFHTQRAAGRPFVFTIQGDSHPERPQMSHPDLYARTLLAAAEDRPDFHVCMGDDFSVAPVREVNAATIGERYLLQRPFLGLVAQSAPLFLLNGNHEQASLFNFNQTDIRHQVAVLAQNARNRYYPAPTPDAFYSGDTAALPTIGLLRDYHAWTWGDALFVVLDNYWHSPALVDSGFREEDRGEGRRERDEWNLTLGEAQYRWLQRTLAASNARYKFVFAHHVLGTGRGGIDECDLFEWGGRSRRGDWEFAQRRPGWELPIHQLMVKHGVSIFFQGHDHLFARQERDGIVYQEVPMPADHGYAAYNADRYRSGVKLPNSGHLRVSVAPDGVTVDYLRTFLPQDETAQRKTGDIAHTYTVSPKNSRA